MVRGIFFLESLKHIYNQRMRATPMDINTSSGIIIHIRNNTRFWEVFTTILEVMRHQLIPAIAGGKIINDNERNLLSLPPPRHGGLGLENVCHTAQIKHAWQFSFKTWKEAFKAIFMVYLLAMKSEGEEHRADKDQTATIKQ